LATVRYLVKDRPPFAVMKLGDLTLWASGPGTSAAKTLSDGSKPRPCEDPSGNPIELFEPRK
jgi:hypothetical protein